MRILSIVPNSAATERIFSKMGIVHSKLRSRLHPEKVSKTVLIAEHIGQKWPHPVHESRKRKFGGDTGSTAATVADESEMLEHDPDLEETAATSFTTITDELRDEATDAATSDDISTSSTGSGPNPTPRNSTEGLKLRFLFDSTAGSQAFHYTTQLWKAGEAGLEVETQYHNILHSGTTTGIVES